MKKILLLVALLMAMMLPFSANAEVIGLSPVHLDVGVGWSSTLNSYNSSYYEGTESQGPNFFVGLKFRIARDFLLGVDASLAVQPWTYGTEYSYSYGDGGYYYDYDITVKNRLFFSGDLTLTFHPTPIFYLMVGGGVTGMNSSYEAGYGSHGGHYDDYSDLDGTEFGWNGMVALGVTVPITPFLRVGGELRYQGGYITSADELYDFNTFSANFVLSFF